MLPCVLRAPPFPGVPVEVATISTRLMEGHQSPRADLGAVEQDRARTLRQSLRDSRVGGTFWAARFAGSSERYILCVPRDPTQAAAMLADALSDRTGHEQLILLPQARWTFEVERRGLAAGLTMVRGSFDPWSLLDRAIGVLADADSDFAFLAIVLGLPVQRAVGGGVCQLGKPISRHNSQILPDDEAERLIHQRLVDQCVYRDCFTGEEQSAEQAIAQLREWRGIIDANRGIAAVAGISWWKRKMISKFLWAGGAAAPPFCGSARQAVRVAKGGADIAVWPSRAPRGLETLAKAADVPVRQIEDGFIRSVGLGSDLLPPMSIVVDRQGIYYDPHQPSDLETVLATTQFSSGLIERAKALMAVIVARGVTKYGASMAKAAALPVGVRRVLVPGQVEDDRSVLLGGGDVSGNLDLLRRVRAAEPDAFILFKPHPDVIAGHRRGHVPPEQALRFADQIVSDMAMPALLDVVDAVHVWTSLAGFEALLRGREVVVHGMPFFAGWGLTQDLGPPVAKRTRRLTLEELVAGVLILYPRYLDPDTGLPCSPEVLVSRIVRGPLGKPRWITRMRRAQGRITKRLVMPS